MNIKKIYSHFFYLNTGARITGSETIVVSSFEAFIIMIICAALKKLFLSNIEVGVNLVFACFFIINMVLWNYNQKLYKRGILNFTQQWKKNHPIINLYLKFVMYIYIFCFLNIYLYFKLSKLKSVFICVFA
ncbi:hypothetical protein J2W48_004578 [Flavobacterium piscis]|uniref:Uncharacterized protein n=1 Tax=Flavobacterium piscis TaxID=1114874 RepID=A0ABU1YEU1_9FLAO|nr:hypothetical protein [Flavobacterium piscis]